MVKYRAYKQLFLVLYPFPFICVFTWNVRKEVVGCQQDRFLFNDVYLEKVNSSGQT